MGQLFLWSSKINEASEQEFQTQFGFQLPEPMLEMYENLPQEFIEYLGLFSLESIIEEDFRPHFMMPGLVPFGQDAEGDQYCFYLPWKDRLGRVPTGIWMHETGHFLPVSRSMRAFFVWWLGRQIIDGIGGEDWDELRKILELFQDAVGIEESDLLVAPPASDIAWHTEIMRFDDEAPFSLTLSAVKQFAAAGPDTAMALLAAAHNSMPDFGGSSIWMARLCAMQGRFSDAYRFHAQHLTTPMFVNGYHYWWDSGDLMVPEISETESLDFLHSVEATQSTGAEFDAKISFFQNHDPTDYKHRLELADLLRDQGDHIGALREHENAFFLQAWNDEVAHDLLQTLLCVYPEHNRLREAEQCRRALAKLESGQSLTGR